VEKYNGKGEIMNKFTIKWSSNSKLRKESILSFPIPAKETCPMAGKCKEICYASKGCYRFPVVRKAHKYNLDITKRKDFVSLAVSELKRKKAQYIRPHDSGDFYSQDYLNKWKEIARLIPNKVFLIL